MQMQIKLKELKHSPNNVRQVKASDSSLHSLTESIRSKGLLHNLVVSKNGKGYNVIDGNRRLDALNKIYKDKATPINCVVIEDDTEVGLHANMMREDMHPLDECDVIQALVSDGGEDYDSIALRFGQTENWVKQRIALSELSDLAKQKFRNYEFNLGIAKELTLGTHEKQDEYLTENEIYYKDSARRFLTTNKIPASKALFKIDDTNIDELAIEKDLFGDEEFVTNREAFERMQMAYVNSQVEAKKIAGYHDVILLVDTYSWESPEVKHLHPAYGDSYDRSQLIMVLSYQSGRYDLNYSEYIAPEEYDNEEKMKEEIQEEEELTPLVMSKPQRDILNGYYAEHVKEKLNNKKYINLMMALLCHRKLGYTAFESMNRIGNIYSDTQNNFPSGGEPDDNPTPSYIKCIEDHTERAVAAYQSDGTSPLRYCLTLSTKELDSLFIACCVSGISRTDLQDETLTKEIGNDSIASHWFKPDQKWLNKYTKEQIGQLELMVFGIDYPTLTKANRTKKLSEALATNPVFDPYGSWPQ